MNQRTSEKGKLTNMKMLMLMPRRTTSREMGGKYHIYYVVLVTETIIKTIKVDIYLQLHYRCQWNSVLEPAQGHYKLVLLDTVCRRRFLEGRNTQAYKVPVAECCLHSYTQQDKEHIEESVPIKIKKRNEDCFGSVKSRKKAKLLGQKCPVFRHYLRLGSVV